MLKINEIAQLQVFLTSLVNKLAETQTSIETLTLLAEQINLLLHNIEQTHSKSESHTIEILFKKLLEERFKNTNKAYIKLIR